MAVEVITSDPAVIEADMSRWVGDQGANMMVHLARTLQDYTPVRSGWAKSNWVGSVGSPNTSTVGSKEAVDGSRFEASLTALRSWEAEIERAYIANNVPYIARLNDGWSAQAPAGFIEAAVDQAVAGVALEEDS